MAIERRLTYLPPFYCLFTDFNLPKSKQNLDIASKGIHKDSVVRQGQWKGIEKQVFVGVVALSLTDLSI
jgi:hypothetical protein